jgi:hypothetical protein
MSAIELMYLKVRIYKTIVPCFSLRRLAFIGAKINSPVKYLGRNKGRGRRGRDGGVGER